MNPFMPRRLSLPALVASALAAALPASVEARDLLEDILRKDVLDARDRATIDQEVGERAKDLDRAAGNPQRRVQARESLLQSALNRRATKPFLDAYADECQTHLRGFLTGPKLEIALDAALILAELKNVNVAPALAAALRSEHAAVRYIAARAIAELHKAFEAQAELARPVIQALGAAGALEKDELVLARIYEALDFAADVPDFSMAAECAQALGDIFARRIGELQAGGHDEWKDLPGYAAAANCYPRAGPAGQARLIEQLVGFLGNHVERYFEPEAPPEYVRKVGQLAEEAEQAVHKMLRDSKVSPPSEKVSAALSGRPTAARQRRATSALEALRSLTRGAPWNLP